MRFRLILGDFSKKRERSRFSARESGSARWTGSSRVFWVFWINLFSKIVNLRVSHRSFFQSLRRFSAIILSIFQLREQKRIKTIPVKSVNVDFLKKNAIGKKKRRVGRSKKLPIPITGIKSLTEYFRVK